MSTNKDIIITDDNPLFNEVFRDKKQRRSRSRSKNQNLSRIEHLNETVTSNMSLDLNVTVEE